MNSLRVTRWPLKSKDPPPISTTSRDTYDFVEKIRVTTTNNQRQQAQHERNRQAQAATTAAMQQKRAIETQAARNQAATANLEETESRWDRFVTWASTTAENIGQTVSEVAVDHRHTAVNLGTGIVAVVGVGIVCGATLGVGCVVGAAIGATVIGTGAHLGVDALTEDDGRELDLREATAQAGGSAVAGVLCASLFGSGCAGSTTRALSRAGAVSTRASFTPVGRSLQSAVGSPLAALSGQALTLTVGQGVRTVISSDTLGQRASRVRQAVDRRDWDTIIREQVFG